MPPKEPTFGRDNPKRATKATTIAGLGPGLFLVAAALLTGCPKPAPEAAANSVQSYDWAQMPHLPSPTAGTYARVPSKPKDPGVALIMGDRQWDASLAGAAANLALLLSKGQAMTPWTVRDSAWHAGYPHPVTRARSWATAEGSPPPASLSQLVAGLSPQTDVGLVRARGRAGDMWVLLTAEPRMNIGIHSRQSPIGGLVSLPQGTASTRFWVSNPLGQVEEGSLEMPQQITLTMDGEWLIGIQDDKGIIARFPVYAGMVPPNNSIFEDPARAPVDTADAERRALKALEDIRSTYGASDWTRDALLDASAKAGLTNPDIGPKSGPTLGFSEDKLFRIDCQGKTMESCFDPLIWSPKSRTALISDASHYGLAIEQGPANWKLVMLIALK